MSPTGRVWIVAASIGTVEGLKDQGICRWNHTIRSLEERAKGNIKTFAHDKLLSSSPVMMGNVSVKKSEESLEKIMHLDCWGPNTTRF